MWIAACRVIAHVISIILTATCVVGFIVSFAWWENWSLERQKVEPKPRPVAYKSLTSLRFLSFICRWSQYPTHLPHEIAVDTKQVPGMVGEKKSEKPEDSPSSPWRLVGLLCRVRRGRVITEVKPINLPIVSPAWAFHLCLLQGPGTWINLSYKVRPSPVLEPVVMGEREHQHLYPPYLVVLRLYPAEDRSHSLSGINEPWALCILNIVEI